MTATVDRGVAAGHLTIAPRAAAEWRALTLALAVHGPASCERSALPPDAWWSTCEEDVALARQTCRTCGVRRECLTYALAAREREGVWGGQTPAERVQ